MIVKSGGGNGEASISDSLCYPNVQPRHLRVVLPVTTTEGVVGDRVIAGICDAPWAKKPEGRTIEDIDARRWCLLKNTEKKATGNHLSTFPSKLKMAKLKNF